MTPTPPQVRLLETFARSPMGLMEEWEAIATTGKTRYSTLQACVREYWLMRTEPQSRYVMLTFAGWRAMRRALGLEVPQ